MQDDDGDKGRRSPALVTHVRVWLAHIARSACTYYRDYVPIVPVLLVKAIGYAYATQELLQPADVVVVQVASAIFHIVFILTLASWVGIVYHGPGRVPQYSHCQASEFPAPVAAALSAGHFCTAAPFDARDRWCSACNCWQPAMAEHCNVCRRCTMWKDRHFLYGLQCVGFRNLRCFFLWLFYVRVLSLVGLALLPVRLLFGGISADPWLYLRFFMFFVPVFIAGGTSKKHMSKLWVRLSDGWPSQVLLAKFNGIVAHADELNESMAAGMDNWTTIEDCQEMTAAIQRVRKHHGRLKGLFGGKDKLACVAFMMGGPPSFRWLLPLVSGGSGDPLQPTLYDADACEAWAALGDSIERFRDRYLQWRSAEESKLAALIAAAERATAIPDQNVDDPARSASVETSAEDLDAASSN